ncbi:MAG: FkbM family methyltransferase [Gaiellaceae bacterium]
MGLKRLLPASFKRLIRTALGRDLFLRPQVSVPTKRLGAEFADYSVCPQLIAPGSIVYSLGIGYDVSFDLSMIEDFGASVYAFDPTPRSIDWIATQQLPEKFRFFPYGIASFDGTARFYPPDDPEHVSHSVVEKKATASRAIEVPVRRLASIMSELGHDRVDVIKMDIEGAEYDVVEDIIASKIDFGQLVLEVHHRFEGFGPAATRAMIERLNGHGYSIFSVSRNGEIYGFARFGD